MNSQTIAIFFFSLATLRCTPPQEKSEIIRENFRIPVVIQELTKDPIELFKVDSLDDVWFEFYGKYKFSDTLKLAVPRKEDTTFRKDFIYEYQGLRKNDTLTTDGFQIFPDYNTTIRHKEEYLSIGNSIFPCMLLTKLPEPRFS